MICYKELYGADADGNRGQWVWECELEESDRPEIEEQVAQYIKDNGLESEDEYPETIDIVLVNPYNDEDYTSEVDVKEYV